MPLPSFLGVPLQRAGYRLKVRAVYLVGAYLDLLQVDLFHAGLEHPVRSSAGWLSAVRWPTSKPVAKPGCFGRGTSKKRGDEGARREKGGAFPPFSLA